MYIGNHIIMSHVDYCRLPSLSKLWLDYPKEEVDHLIHISLSKPWLDYPKDCLLYLKSEYG